jgi:hypothetical protein
LPPEIHGLSKDEGVEYMINNYPYPLLRAMLPAMWVLADDVFGTERYIGIESNFSFPWGFQIMGGQKKYKAYVVQWPSLRAMVEDYEHSIQLFDHLITDWQMLRLKFVSSESSKVMLLIINYTNTPNPVRKRRNVKVFGVTDIPNAVRYFGGSLVSVGEFDPQLLDYKISKGVWRQMFLDFGIVDIEDYILMNQNCSRSYAYFKNQALYFKKHDGSLKGWVDDCFYYVRSQLGGGKPLSVGDRLLLNLQKFHVTVQFASDCDSAIGERVGFPEIKHFAEGVAWIRKWITTICAGSAHLFFLHLATVISGKNNRRRLFCLFGCWESGKSFLTYILSVIFKVHPLLLLKEKDMDCQMAYAEHKDLMVMDDFEAEHIMSLSRKRVLLEGGRLTVNRKYQDQRDISLPPIILTTNEDMQLHTEPAKIEEVTYLCFFFLFRPTANMKSFFCLLVTILPFAGPWLLLVLQANDGS